jgi:hypothetical protein
VVIKPHLEPKSRHDDSGSPYVAVVAAAAAAL